jgi:hypothetical protein
MSRPSNSNSMSSVVSNLSAASVSSAANIKRVLSFGRSSRRPGGGENGRLRAATTPSQSSSAPVVVTPDPIPPAIADPPAPSTPAAHQGTAGKKVSRRAISFGRAKRGMREPSNKPLRTADVPASELHVAAGSSTPARIKLNIKRTTSWARGHKQSARATRVMVERLLIEVAPLLLRAVEDADRGPLAQVTLIASPRQWGTSQPPPSRRAPPLMPPPLHKHFIMTVSFPQAH